MPKNIPDFVQWRQVAKDMKRLIQKTENKTKCTQRMQAYRGAKERVANQKNVQHLVRFHHQNAGRLWTEQSRLHNVNQATSTPTSISHVWRKQIRICQNNPTPPYHCEKDHFKMLPLWTCVQRIMENHYLFDETKFSKTSAVARGCSTAPTACGRRWRKASQWSDAIDGQGLT